MKVNIYVIDKKSKHDIYAPLIEHYIKSAKQFAKVEVFEIFNKEISKAQEISPQKAQEEYTKALQKQMSDGYNITLNPSSKELDSHEFANLFKDRAVVNLFIGGAYGLERAFLDKSNISVSFGKITLSHRLAKVVALEQVFRGLSIINAHPYHK